MLDSIKRLVMKIKIIPPVFMNPPAIENSTNNLIKRTSIHWKGSFINMKKSYVIIITLFMLFTITRGFEWDSSIYYISDHVNEIYSVHPSSSANVNCMCSILDTNKKSEIKLYEKIVLNKYIELLEEIKNSNIDWFPVDMTDVSCIIVDNDLSLLWVIADTIGINPIWYSIHVLSQRNSDGPDEYNQRIIVTTDLIYAIKSGFKQPSALGAGQVLAIDLKHFEIVRLKQRVSSQVHDRYSSPEYYSYHLFSNGLSAIKKSVLSSELKDENKSFVIEMDHTEPASILLNCLLNALGEPYQVRYSRPLVTEDDPTSFPPELSHILEGIEMNYNFPSSHVWSPNLRRMVLDRWQICQAAADSGIYFSYDTGLELRPVKIYLQNMLCSYLGVKVIYPFSSIDFHQALSSSIHTKSYFYQASVIIENTPDYCHREIKTGNTKVDLIHYDNKSFSIKSATKSFIVDEFDFGVCEGAGCIDHSFSRSIGTKIGKLWSITSGKSTQHLNEIVVVLATAGYHDIFANFVCSVTKLNFTNLLVLTNDPNIAQLATIANLSIYTPVNSNNNFVDFAEFGSLTYQQLILFRTETVMDLLHLGFKVLVADIDTVWLSNPLLAVSNKTMMDLVVTDDGGEVCGCFVYINSTERALAFWSFVTLNHKKLVDYSIFNNSMQLNHFHDSEQKILTNLLYKNMYTNRVDVAILPKDQFPSGFAYFNTYNHYMSNTKTQQPVVIHNNYIIGKSMKIKRFAKYSLWSYNAYANYLLESDNSGLLFCNQDEYDHGYYIFPSVYNNFSIPSVNIILPVHNSIINTTNYVIQVTMEGVEPGEGGVIYIENDPPSFINFVNIATIELTKTNNDSELGFLSSIVPGSNLQVSVDISMQSTIFSMDRKKQFIDLTNQRVAYYNSYSSKNTNLDDLFDICYEFSDPFLLCDRNSSNFKHFDPVTINGATQLYTFTTPIFINNNNNNNNNKDNNNNDNNNNNNNSNNNNDNNNNNNNNNNSSSNNSITFHIKVITYNRPQSLLRLLNSLASADYFGINVSLDIIIDGPKNEFNLQEMDKIDEVARISDLFNWPFGLKKIYKRTVNIGLASQWYYAWSPNASNETAFIFEDDIEVSPLYFKWAFNAVNSYYTTDLQFVHWELLNAVRGVIKNNHTEKDSTSTCVDHYNDNNNSSDSSCRNFTLLEHFTRKYAGIPLIYGVCMQKQHLDPSHYPKRLVVSNSDQPYLYSLIGSWGPLFLPVFWEAFREWWIWTERSGGTPLTENIVTNNFYRTNPKLWTPWIVRFAYETGMKCLYTNFPDDLALVINHREDGVSYSDRKGSASTLLRKSDYSERLFHLPSIRFLANWQLDFNLRRAGGYAGQQSIDVKRLENPNDTAYVEFTSYFELYDAKMSRSDIIHTQKSSLPQKRIIFRPAFYHTVWNVLDAYISYNAFILHFGVTLLFPYLQIHNHYPSVHNYFLSESESQNMPCDSHVSLLLSISKLNSELTCIKNNLSRHFDFVVLELSETTKEQGDSYYSKALTEISASYLIVIGNCYGAPTDINTRRKFCEPSSSKLYAINTTTSCIYDFSLVEELCDNDNYLKGILIYRNTSEILPTADQWYSHRHALSKRLVGNLVSTTIKLRENTEIFI